MPFLLREPAQFDPAAADAFRRLFLSPDAMAMGVGRTDVVGRESAEALREQLAKEAFRELGKRLLRSLVEPRGGQVDPTMPPAEDDPLRIRPRVRLSRDRLGLGLSLRNGDQHGQVMLDPVQQSLEAVFGFPVGPGHVDLRGFGGLRDHPFGGQVLVTIPFR